ncbi:MAG TPA: S53 family peptidase [Candidatus Binataceae bacterium]|nr:S53 family peptidase [Candidatus Binataceae bacterium]
MKVRVAAALVIFGSVLLLSMDSVQAQTVTIPNNHPAFQLPSPQAPITSTRTLNLTIFLALQNSAQLQTLLTNLQTPSSVQFHQWLSSSQFQATYYPTTSQISALTTWLSSQGFTVTPPIANSLAVSFSGTAGQVEAAFGVTLIKSTAIGLNPSGVSFYENTADPSVPSQFQGLIAFIEGLDNLGSANNLTGSIVYGDNVRVPAAAATSSNEAGYAQDNILNPTTTATPSPTPTCSGSAPTPVPSPGVYHFKPADLYTYYNANVVLNHNQGTQAPDCIAIIASVDFGDDAFSEFATSYGLPNTLPIRVPVQNSTVSQGCGAGEVSLDIEWSHTLAPQTPQRVYEFGGNVDLVQAFLAPVNDNVCGVISSSIGPGCNQQDGGYYHAMDEVFQQAAAQGQTFFEAAGDKGAAAEALRIESGNLVCDVGTSNNASAIGGSPNVVAVGGSQFTPTYDSNGNNTSVQGPGPAMESVWGNDGQNGAGGGGISAIFALPPWQTNVQNQLGYTSNMRLLPDLVFGASEIAPGFYIYVDYGDGTGAHLHETGGTSIATPMLAGMSRLIAQAANLPRLGNINPLLYGAAGSGTSITGIFDITQGSNAYNGATGYNAQPGFDLASGWGSPNVGSFVAYFSQVVTGATPTATPTAAPTATPTAAPTSSPSVVPTATATAIPTTTATVIPTATPPPTPTPGAQATSVPVTSQGVAGQNIAAGALRVTNSSSTPESLQAIQLQISNPGLFSALKLTVTIGGTQQTATSGTLGTVTNFSFTPVPVLPAGATALFTLSGTLISNVALGGGAVRMAGLMLVGTSPGDHASMLLAALMLTPGLMLIGMPATLRRRIALLALMLLALAVSQVACTSSGSNSPTVLTSSTQVVSAVTLVNSGGAVPVQGLPSLLGTVQLVK